MKNNKSITRAEALKKMGKYSALTATATFMLLSPRLSAQSSPTGGEDVSIGGDGNRPGSIWKD